MRHQQPQPEIKRSQRRTAMVGLSIVLVGCVGTPHSPMTARRAFDSPAPLGAQEELETHRPTLAAPEEAGEPIAKRTAPAESPPGNEAADPDEPPGPVLAPLDSSLEAVPRIEPLEVTPREPLELSVAAPARRPVGGEATYRVTLRNASDRPLDELAVHCRFGEALVLPGRGGHEVRRRIERLAAGQSRELALTLTSDVPGSHVSHFVVTRDDAGEERELVSREVVVEFVDRPVEIDIVGPTSRTEGSRAEFNITLLNRSSKTITDAQASVSFDKALFPKEASAEAVQKPGSLLWRLGALEPMEKVQLQIEFECRSRAHRACVTVEFRGANLRAEQEEGCVEIGPVPGTLDLQIVDRADPFEVGKNGTYELTVQNIGLQLARRVVLEANIPENLKLVSASVRSTDGELPLKTTIQNEKLVFEAISELQPNGKLVYAIEVEALRPGAAELRASLTSSLSGTAITASEPTLVTEP